MTLAHRFAPGGRVREAWLIRGVQAVSLVAAGLLAVFWAREVAVAGVQRSVPYLLLAYLLALGCCTSNVTFLPFMCSFPQPYLRSFFIGQGLSALFPCLMAIAQGVGRLECRNGSEPRYLEVNFPASNYLWGTFALLAASALAFAALPWCRRTNQEQPGQELGAGPQDGAPSEDSLPLQTPETAKAALPTFWTPRNIYLLVLLGVSNALTNGVLPSVQTYSCLPYGADAYHWSVVLSNIANPAACFIAMVILCR